MSEESTRPYLFGDLLALARQSWIKQMEERLVALGYADYHRSDAMAMRLLRLGPIPVGRIGPVHGVTRQAARKIVEGLERRGYARTERGTSDTRQLNVVLTPAGEAYANAVVSVIHELNAGLRRRVDPEALAAADSVLRAAITDDDTAQRAARLVAPPGPDTPD